MEDDYNSEDDGPIVFKRSTNKNQSNPEVKKSSSQRNDGAQGRQGSDVRQSNGQSSTLQKGKTTVPSSNASPTPLANRKPSLTPKASPVTSPPPMKNGKASTSAADHQSKNSSQLNAKPVVKEEKPSVKHDEVSDAEDSDEEDDKPINARRLTGPSKPNLNHANKGPGISSTSSPPPVQKPRVFKKEDSDDEAPLSSKYAVKSNNANKGPGISSTNSPPPVQKPRVVKKVDSDDEAPLSSKYAVKSNNANKGPGISSTNSPPPVQKPRVVKKVDSDDEVPLSSKYVVKSNNANKGPGISSINSPPPVQKPRFVKKEDSDDEAPLSSKYQVKSNNAASTSKDFDSDEKNPLALRVQQNGSTNNQIKTSSSSLKRPIGEVKSSGESSVKKPKLSNSPPPTNSKQVVSAKAEPESESESESDDDDEDDDDDDVPISKRLKMPAVSNNKPSSSAKQKVTKVVSSSFKKTSQSSKKVMKSSTYSKSLKVPPGSGEGKKWTTLVHNGVIFPPPYQPHGVKMLYKGKPVDLTPEQEEVATMFAVMLDTDYMNKPKFKENFFGDWKKILGKNHVIQNLEDCNFRPIYEWHLSEKEKKKQMTTEEKKAIKEEKMKLEEKYMWAIVDGVKEKVGNFRVEPPGLFRGRGEHPKMGKFKRRIRPSDITINIGKDAPIPECPIPRQSWKEVKHDNTVTWLAFWNDPINSKEFKYVFLAASSSLKGQSDKDKYEKARKLKDYIHGIRAAYTKDFASKDIAKKQIAVATYLIDKLALRAGNEKDDDEADTVGCCTLKVENVEPEPPNILKFDFLGKDSIRYQNEVEVEVPVYKAIQQFRAGKDGGDDLFDKLDTSKLNAHLKGLMPGLTAKVFRTYNASITLDDMLSKETKGGDVAQKVVVYNHANKEVAIICNHQRTVSKTHSAQMTRLNEKIDELKGVLEELKTDLSRVKKGKPPLKSADGKPKRNLNPEALERKINQTNAKIEKMERDKETKEDLKTVALGTSKINYLDPRITVAWCKRHEVPIEKMFNKSLLAKFAWAMDVEPGFRF